MKVGLIDVDGHNYPNLPLMKLSAWHKKQGDHVEWYSPLLSPDMDIVYMSKVFSFTKDFPFAIRAEKVVKGGTGYCITLENGKEVYHKEKDTTLPLEVEKIMPDYSLYDTQNTAYGFTTRGCPRGCPFCHVAAKEGRKSVCVADLFDFYQGQKNIVLMDANILACADHERILKQMAKTDAWVDFNQGIDARLINQDNIQLLNAIKMKSIHFAWDLMDQSEKVVRGLSIYAKNGRVNKDHRRVYVLTNYNTTHEEDLYRIYHLKEMGYIPYTMVYDKKHAPKQTLRIQRWTNNVVIWKSCERFEDYVPTKGGKE